jgi:hypothetical protein
MLMKNSNYTIGNRTRDLLTCINQLRHCVPSICNMRNNQTTSWKLSILREAARHLSRWGDFNVLPANRNINLISVIHRIITNYTQKRSLWASKMKPKSFHNHKVIIACLTRKWTDRKSSYICTLGQHLYVTFVRLQHQSFLALTKCLQSPWQSAPFVWMQN